MLKLITNVAIEAGRMIQQGIYSEKKIRYKGESDLVTDYDVKVENFLKDKLSKMFPGYRLIAEESSAEPGVDGEEVIYIDPIDGTTNFVHGFPFVSVSIGVYSGGEGLYATVFNPVIGEIFTASKDGGAFRNGDKIRVSDTRYLDKSLCATGFPYDKRNLSKLMPVLEKILRTTRGIRRAGSAALDLCYVASGIFDLYYETELKPWDAAGGTLILKEAGGTVTDMKGDPYDLYSSSILATNGLVTAEFLQLAEEAGWNKNASGSVRGKSATADEASGRNFH